MQVNNSNVLTDNSDHHHLHELIVHEETKTDTALIEHATKTSKDDCQKLNGDQWRDMKNMLEQFHSEMKIHQIELNQQLNCLSCMFQISTDPYNIQPRQQTKHDGNHDGNDVKPTMDSIMPLFSKLIEKLCCFHKKTYDMHNEMKEHINSIQKMRKAPFDQVTKELNETTKTQESIINKTLILIDHIKEGKQNPLDIQSHD